MEMNRSVTEVEAVTAYYYKTLRSKLSGLTHATVHVQNLGNFYIKENALDANIQRHEALLSKLGNDNIEEYGMKKEVRADLEKMKAIKEKLNQERGRRREIINKRFNNESKEEHNPDMEEQGPYSRRCNE